MHGHLVAVEVCVESCADKGVNLDSLAFDQDRLERLNAKSVKRWSAIQENRMFTNHFFQNIPDDRLLTLYHLARLLNGRSVLLLLKLVVDERLE